MGKSRLARLLAALVLAVGVIAPVGLANPQSASAYDYCENWARTPRHYGIANNPGNAIGVAANIDPPYEMVTCTDGFGDDDVSAWIAILPADGQPGGESSIMQIGVIASNGANGTAGQQLRFFWAQGGCNLDQAIPEYFTVPNVSPYGNNRFRIQYTGGDWVFYINGAEVQRLDGTDSRVYCWTRSYKKLQVAGETHDGGSQFTYDHAQAAYQLHFTNIDRMDSSNGLWQGLYWGPGSCPAAPDSLYWDYHCYSNDVTGNDGFYVWNGRKY